MRHVLFLLFCQFLCVICAAQLKPTAQGNITFDYAPSNTDFFFYRDTMSDPNNIWQVGAPHKTVLNAADSPPNVVITDTINTYPVNDTSRFILWQRAGQGWATHYSAKLHGWYQVHTDTLVDYGLIEVSVDNGQNWVNVLTDTQYQFFTNVSSTKPVLSGNSDGLLHLFIDFTPFSDSMNVQLGDTILIRFSFISDNNQTNKDGIMYDGFFMEDWTVGITDMKNPGQQVNAYPNPVRDELHIKLNEQAALRSYTIYTMQGQAVLQKDGLSGDELLINTTTLTPGYYTLELFQKGGTKTTLLFKKEQ